MCQYLLNVVLLSTFSIMRQCQDETFESEKGLNMYFISTLRLPVFANSSKKNYKKSTILQIRPKCSCFCPVIVSASWSVEEAVLYRNAAEAQTQKKESPISP